MNHEDGPSIGSTIISVTAFLLGLRDPGTKAIVS